MNHYTIITGEIGAIGLSNIQWNGLKIRYEYRPSKKHVKGNLLLLHTIGKTMEEWDAFLSFCEEDFNILRYDLLGHGHSDLPSQSFSMKILVDQLNFMAQHFFDQAFFIVANPASGYIATSFCRKHGERAAGVLLISPPPTYLPLKDKQAVLNQIKERAQEDYEAFKQFMIDQISVKSDRESTSFLKRLFDQTSCETYLAFMEGYLSPQITEDFPFIQTPIHILAGAKDPLFPVSVYGVTANVMKASLEVAPEASTLVAFDQPEETVKVLLRFIDQIVDGAEKKVGFSLDFQSLTTALWKSFNEPTAHPTMSVRLLDTFSVTIEEVKLVKGWNVRKAKSLFLYLLFQPTVKRENLMDIFWPDLSLSQAQNQLRVSLSHLKSLLHLHPDMEWIVTDRETVSIKGDIQCDAWSYLSTLQAAYAECLSGTLTLEQAQAILQTSPSQLMTQLYDDWFLEIRESIELHYTTISQWVAQQFTRDGQPELARKYEQMSQSIMPF